jgi:hypothetical protein
MLSQGQPPTANEFKTAEAVATRVYVHSLAGWVQDVENGYSHPPRGFDRKESGKKANIHFEIETCQLLGLGRRYMRIRCDSQAVSVE